MFCPKQTLDNDKVSLQAKHAAGRAVFVDFPQYIEFQAAFQNLKGVMKERRSNMLRVNENNTVTMNVMAKTFIGGVEDFLNPSPVINLLQLKNKQAEDLDREPDSEDGEELPQAYLYSKGELEVPVISHWTRRAGTSVTKADANEKKDLKERVTNVLGKRTPYYPVPLFRTAKFELWFGDARNINVHADPQRRLASAAIGDIPYGLDTSLYYDHKAWTVNDVSFCFYFALCL